MASALTNSTCLYEAQIFPVGKTYKKSILSSDCPLNVFLIQRFPSHHPKLLKLQTQLGPILMQWSFLEKMKQTWRPSVCIRIFLQMKLSQLSTKTLAKPKGALGHAPKQLQRCRWPRCARHLPGGHTDSNKQRNWTCATRTTCWYVLEISGNAASQALLKLLRQTAVTTANPGLSSNHKLKKSSNCLQSPLCIKRI